MHRAHRCPRRTPPLLAAFVALLAAAPPGHAPVHAPGHAPGPVHEGGCAPAGCTLEPPTEAERAAILAEADRLALAHAADTSTLGRQCRALGTTMRARLEEVRMLPFMWRAPDPDGNLGAVTGDAHLREPAAGAGRVHIARGYDPLNPQRGLDAIVETARHEFAHLNGMGRRETWGVDEGARLALECGPTTAN